jgi:succinyl-CoA synthetase alpha subunit
LIGEIGGDEEESAAEYIRNYVTKPVVAYITGMTAPVGKTMGHAGAIMEVRTGTATHQLVRGTAAAKIDALKQAGVPVAETPSEVVKVLTR